VVEPYNICGLGPEIQREKVLRSTVSQGVDKSSTIEGDIDGRRRTVEDNRGRKYRRTVEEYSEGGLWEVAEPDSTSGLAPELE
jgi:hypothetical protein